MRLEIKSTELALTPELRKYVEKSLTPLGRFLKRYEEDEQATAYVEVARTTEHHRKGKVFLAEVTLKLPKQVVRVEESHSDIKGALELVHDTLKRVLIKYKERSVWNIRKKGRNKFS